MIRLAPGPAEIIDHVDTGRLGLDGKTLVVMEGGAFRTRLKMSLSGAAVATIVLNRAGKLLARPRVTVQGLPTGERDSPTIAGAEDAIVRALNDLASDQRDDDDAGARPQRLAVRRSVFSSIGKKPVTRYSRRADLTGAR